MVLHPWVVFSHYWDEARYVIQRGLYGYDDPATYGLYFYIESWLPQALDELRAWENGYPGYGEADTPEKWKAILKEMADGFRAAYDAEENFVDSDRVNKAAEKEKRSLDLFARWFRHLWD